MKALFFLVAVAASVLLVGIHVGFWWGLALAVLFMLA